MSQSQRIELLDFARGIALVAMTIFHFAFDLQLFGFQEPGFIDQPHWKYFARMIATSFLFLVGFSLFLAHSNGILWRNWRVRMIKIVGAAMIITVATYFATPDQFIFFGILHQIAFASLACLIFIRMPFIITTAFAVFVFVWGRTAEFTLFDPALWWWTGLSVVTPNSSDYVPVFPWWSASLLGLAAAKLCVQSGWLDTLARPQFNSKPGRLLKYMGRNSLIYYLLHQPVMIAFILVYAVITGHISL